MSNTSLSLILSPILLVCSSSAGDVRIEHAPKEGAVLTQAFDGTLELRLEELRIQIDEKDLPGWGPPQIEFEERRRTAVIDRYVEMSPAGPLELHRTFEELRNHEVLSGIGPESGEYESEGRLEGETAVFTWLAAQKIYRVEVPSGKWIDPEHLDALSLEGELEPFLPPGEVSPGERWLVDARSLARLYGPGGTAHAVESRMREIVDFQRLLAALKGDLEVRFVGTQRDEDHELAVLEVSRRAEAELEHGSSGENGVWLSLFYYPPRAEPWTEETVMTVEVEATLLWDLRGRHAHSLALETELQLERRFEVELPYPDANTMSVEERWTGRFAVAVEVTRD